MTRTSKRASKSKAEIEKNKSLLNAEDEFKSSEENEKEAGSDSEVELNTSQLEKNKRSGLKRTQEALKYSSSDDETEEENDEEAKVEEIIRTPRSVGRPKKLKKNDFEERGQDKENKVTGKKKSANKTPKKPKKSTDSDESETDGKDNENADGSDSEVEHDTSKKNKRSSLKRSTASMKATLDSSDDEKEENNEEVVESKRPRGRPKNVKKKIFEENKENKATGRKTKQKAENPKTANKTPKKAKNSTDTDEESVTDGKDYEVQKIIDVHFCRDGSREFLVRWKGYKPSDDTWEPEEHLDCPDLIAKLMERVEKAKNSSEKELREVAIRKTVVPIHKTHGNNIARSLRNNGFRPFYQE